MFQLSLWNTDGWVLTAAENRVKGNYSSLKAKVVLAPSHLEVARVAPPGAVGVPENPVLDSVWVDSPAHKGHRVVECLPGAAVVLKGFGAQQHLIFGSIIKRVYVHLSQGNLGS